MIMINNYDLSDEIDVMIQNAISQLPRPEIIFITKIYEDENHVDCKTKAEEKLEYIPTISNNLTVGNTGLLIVTKDDEFIIITK